jgi:diguanylate cyclase (GGDEF)-like protein
LLACTFSSLPQSGDCAIIGQDKQKEYKNYCMDTQTAYVAVTLMMLVNGGVLGLLHRELPTTLRRPALSWLTGTLLVTAGSFMFAIQHLLPLVVVAALANGLIILGFTAYWRSLRQFYNFPSLPILLVPTFIGVSGMFWFASVYPHTGIRILIVSLVWIVLMGGSVYTLWAQRHRDSALSRNVLMVLFVLVMVFALLRSLFYLLVLGVEPSYSITTNDNLFNILSPLLVAVLPVVGTTVFLLMCSERLRRQWERAASTDFLTGLANRRTLSQIGSEQLALRNFQDGCLSLAIIDIDHFKQINDKHGHEIGDIALKHVANLLQTHTRGNELVARMGGEEFVVLLDRVDKPQALRAGERLRHAIQNNPLVAGVMELPLTASIGIALYRKDDANFDGLLSRADQAMYVAKEAGRNRVVLAEDMALGGAPERAEPVLKIVGAQERT